MATKEKATIPDDWNIDLGNGSLMRLAALPIFFCDRPEQARMYATRSSQSTHPGETAALACVVWSDLIMAALGTTQDSIQVLIDQVVERSLSSISHPDISRLLRADAAKDSAEGFWRWRDPTVDLVPSFRRRGDAYNGYAVNFGYAGSYVLDALAIALHSLYSTNNAMDAIVQAINLLGDADTTGAITGQLAGAFYGYGQLDARVCKSIDDWSDREILLRGILLHPSFHARYAIDEAE